MTRREGSGFEILLQTGGITFSFLFANWKCSGVVLILSLCEEGLKLILLS